MAEHLALVHISLEQRIKIYWNTLCFCEQTAAIMVEIATSLVKED
jgi:hypothetical protein